MAEPFHDGEIAVQERAGERAIAKRHGLGIASRIPPAALPWLARQRLLALSTVADDGRLWSSVWFGEPGFVESDDGRRVMIRRPVMAASGDPVAPHVAVGRDVGTLAIELVTRRRLRINGTVERESADEVVIFVRESVGNCPKYIQQRDAQAAPPNAAKPVRGDSGRAIDRERRGLIERVDTCFVGSVHPTRGVDTSHRGGHPGFIRVVDDTTLRVPDYPGNGLYMTLGNFAIDPRASVTALDFDRRCAVSFSGSAQLRFDVEDSSQPTGGTRRYWDFSVEAWRQFALPAGLAWELLGASPYNPPAPR